jgi:phosphate transport system substrate-binding protein
LNRRISSTIAGAVAALSLAACGGGEAGGESGLSGNIMIDGSSTVFPITEAVAEEFAAETGGDVRVTVALSGTGGGFRRFCRGETDISNASRVIEEDEAADCAANGVAYREIPVATDGLAIAVNPANTFVECLTVDELRRIWAPGSTISNWSEVRAEWPNQPLRLYGPGTNSGTFDYFSESINGETGASRSDYTASEDDNVLVQGVSGDVNSLGYFGIAYFMENQSRLKLVAVDSGSGCVVPTQDTVQSGEYAPLSRPLLLYVKQSSLDQPHIRAFLDFYLDTAAVLSAEVGYVPLDEAEYDESRALLGAAADVG